MLDKPDNITELDYKLLKDKYGKNDLEKVLEKIAKDYPVQYAIGDVDFLKSKILVDERVLIPRFETELLVKKTIDYVKKNGLERSDILDICTGSGCIAISMQSAFPKAKVTAVDISKDAIELAKENAELNEVSINFIVDDILKGFTGSDKYSVIVSNPPYVRLDEEVSVNTKFEPSIALYPGKDDLLFYRVILERSKRILQNKSIIAFEIGSQQGDEVCSLAKNVYPSSRVVLERDYAGLDRFVFVFNNCE